MLANAETETAPARVPRRLYPLPEVQAQLGNLSRATLYNLFAADQLRPVKVGARTFVEAAELDRFVASLAPIPAKAA